jgi:hypothetical protein
VHATTSEIPLWIQTIFVGAGAIAVFIGTLYTYIKRKLPPPPVHGDVAVVSATFADRETAEKLHRSLDGLCRHLCDTMDELQYLRREINSDSRNRNDTAHALIRALDQTGDAMIQTSDAMVNFVAFIQRRDAAHETPLKGGPHLSE